MGYSSIISSFFSSLKAAWRYTFGDTRRAMIALFALACTGVSLIIGFTYAGYPVVPGWQLWTWLAAVIGILLALIPPLASRLPRGTFVILFGLLAAALTVRLFRLASLPPGMHIDELGVADFAMRQVFFSPFETINPFITGPESHPVLFHYIVAAFIKLFGPHIFSLRLQTALIGTLGVLATYLMVRAFSGKRAALFAALLMVAYHYHVHWSRISLNNIWDTLWVPLMLGPFLWGWRKQWSGGAALSGLAVGLSQYFYPGSKIGLVLLGGLILVMWKEGRHEPGRWAIYLGKLVLVTVCAAAPIVAFALHNPQAYLLRTQTIMGWSPETISIILGPQATLGQYFWYQLTHSFGTYLIYPDDTGFYRPGVPLVFGPAAIVFGVGFLWAIFKKQGLPVLWIIITALLGGFMLSGPSGSSHFVVAIPAICWLIALPLTWLAENKHPRLAWALLALLIAIDIIFYFGIYAANPSGDLVNPFPPVP
jgi:hypothetical protein